MSDNMTDSMRPNLEKLERWRRGEFQPEDFPSEDQYEFYKLAKDSGVDPALPKLKEKVPPNDLAKVREELGDVVEFLESHKGTMTKSPCAWIITDTHGNLIRTVHDNPEVLQAENNLPLTRGVSFALEDAGINAISKALFFKNTRHCTGPEHTLEILRHYVAVGSPLFDVDGRIRACLGFFLPAHLGSATLARLYMFTVLQSLDQRRRLTHFRKEVMQTNQLHLQMLNGSMPNALFLSIEGRILFLGEGATKTFDITPRKVGQLVDDLFSLKPSLPEILSDLKSNPQISLESEELGKSWKAQIFPVYHHEHLAGIWLCTLGEKENGDESHAESPFFELLGNNPHLIRAKGLAEQLAPSDISVLLIGSSGTGKELFAKGIHQASTRKEGPFISLNCGALPKDLAESELFGYAPGAFTGALKEGKEGLMESAAGGTLFLDEIGDMPMDLQVKLLRVLETQTLTRLGETQERPLDLRLVAATHRNLLHLVEHGKFREDLYFRLAASTILIPALNQMKEDIPTIFLHYLNLFCRRNGKPTPDVPESLLAQLMKLQWRGNVRELRNAAEYSAAVSHPGQPLDIGHLPGLVRLSILFPDDGSDSTEEASTAPPPSIEAQPAAQIESEAQLWQRVHQECQGNAKAMMKKLGISRATLYRKLGKFGLLKRDHQQKTT